MFQTTEVDEDHTEPWRGRRVCIDFDEVAYKAASGNETRGIRVKENKPFAMWKEYSTRTEFYAKVGGKDKAKDYTIEDVQYPFRLEKSFHKVDEAVREAMEKCDTDDMIGYMGSGSPRDFIATVEVYKGQRENMLRPVQLPEVRQYCIDKWGAIEVDGTKYEADDMLSIEAYQTGAIQVTQDKDACQTRGWLLKPDWPEPRWMHEFGWVKIDRSLKNPKFIGAGQKSLAMQVMTKDGSDNYHANKLSDKSFGIIKAEKLITPCQTPEELWNMVADHFKWLYPEPVEYNHAYTGEPMTGTWDSLMAEYIALAKMKYSLDEELDGYAFMDKYGVEYG